jgi:hypothetical protein
MADLSAPAISGGELTGTSTVAKIDPPAQSKREVLVRQGRALVEAIKDDDEAAVEAAVLALSRSRRIFAPLVFCVGAFVMLFQGLRLLFFNWRLTLIQLLPAMWIWVAMFDLKLHVIKGNEFRYFQGSVAVALVLGITLISVASFYLNAVFAFAIADGGQPQIRPAFSRVRAHLRVVVAAGVVVGLALGVSTVIVPRWGLGWFALSLGIVVAVMMFTYVTLPARLVGIRPTGSRRDKLAASVVGGTIGAVVCTPPYVIGRIGILLLGSKPLFFLGVILLAIGLTLQVGATGAVKAIKMSAKLATGTASQE